MLPVAWGRCHAPARLSIGGVTGRPLPHGALGGYAARVNRSTADHWSVSRSLAFLVATFAIVLGTLLPFGAMAAARPGETLVFCTAEGPQTVQVGGEVDGPGGKAKPAKCAACVMPLLAALPVPPTPEPTAAPVFAPAAVWVAENVSPPPPARAPPRPPSTAPPLA